MVLSALQVEAQTPAEVPKILADTARSKQPPRALQRTSPTRKNFGRAALFLGLDEVLPWTYDRYIAKKDYARISGKTVKYNLDPGHWAFDNDEFETNQFGHPYHGSQFYSAMRVNGYSFWQSVPASFVGSYLWETFAEKQAPAPNDFINTGFGGAVLGEMTYRLSNRVVNNRTRGFRRQASEVLALIINPTNGLNRLLSGKWGRISENSAERDSSKVSADFDLGIRKYSTGPNLVNGGKFGWFGRVRLVYGTPYEDYATPFSNVYINAEFGQDDSSKVNIISVYGSIHGWELQGNDKVEQLAIISANYDFIQNVAFAYGGQSVKMNLFSDYTLSSKFKLTTSIGAGPVILAAVPDKYYFKGRSYDYNTGASLVGGIGFNLFNRFYYSLDYRGAWLATLNGNASHYFLHAVTSDFRFAINKQFSVSAEPGYFVLKGNYKAYPDITSKYPYLRISARYSVDL